MLSHLDEIARDVFAGATQCYVFTTAHSASTNLYRHIGGGSAVTTPSTETARADDPILGAVEDLKEWLNVSYEDLARILGWQTASNIYYWRRCAQANEPIRPRASTVEPILRLHILLRSITEVLSGDDPRAVQLWTRTATGSGQATPLELLQEGRLDLVEREASRLLFDRTSAQSRPWRQFLPADADEQLKLTSPSPDYEATDFG
jgi:hypothetical protein